MRIFEEKMFEEADFVQQSPSDAVERGRFLGIKSASESFSEKIHIPCLGNIYSILRFTFRNVSSSNFPIFFSLPISLRNLFL